MIWTREGSVGAICPENAARSPTVEISPAAAFAAHLRAVQIQQMRWLKKLRRVDKNTLQWPQLFIDKGDALIAALARETERLSGLVERLLDFGRMEAGALRYRPEPLDLGKLVRSVVDEFEHVVADTGHRIEVTIGSDTLQLFAQPYAPAADNALPGIADDHRRLFVTFGR